MVILVGQFNSELFVSFYRATTNWVNLVVIGNIINLQHPSDSSRSYTYEGTIVTI